MHQSAMLLSGHYAAATVIGLLLSLVSFLLLTGYQRKVVYHRLAPWLPLTARPRRTSSSKTPPRSISPERKPPGNVPPPVEHKDIFPPWRRDALVPAATSSPFARKNEPPGAFDDSPDRIFRESLIPFTTDYRICASPAATYTPMGISLSEIAALSDFPDYAKLSGVPLPIPYTDFRIETALPRPYRPFRWAYHQTMSLTRLEKDWWLEMESNFVESIRERKELFDKYGTMMLNYLPGSELACKELMEMVLQFQCARYPQYFSLSHSEQRGHVFHNGILKNETVIRDMHPLHVLLENVPEDFAVMLRNPEDGHYYLRAGVLCSSLGWNLSTKLGMQLKEIHQPIPDYKEKMEFSMDRYAFFPFPFSMAKPHAVNFSKVSTSLRALKLTVSSRTSRKLPLIANLACHIRTFSSSHEIMLLTFTFYSYFAKLPPARPIQRGSWGLEIDKPLFMPPGDPHEAYRGYQMDPAELPLSRIHLRVDWQTLRRLPLSGSIIFNFKALFTPVEDFRE